MYTWYIGTIDNDKVEDTMAMVTIIRVRGLDEIEFDTTEEMVEYAIERVGEFASGVGAEVDVTLDDLNVLDGEVAVEVGGTPDDVALVSRRWYEEEDM